MSTWVGVVIAILVVVAVVILISALVVGRRKRTARLKERFGPEYERAIASSNDRGAAERDLLERQRSHDTLDVRALTPAERDEYEGQWRGVQTAFVDDPSRALNDANRLVNAVMRARGYPVDDFEQQSAHVSVDHPTVVQNYRAAHAIRVAQEHGDIAVDGQRQAFVHYRTLFDTLLTPDDATTKETSA